ncbi:MAG: DUF11 domain-containing protein [Verrucomicrobia bacterium]|nr:DUF11 domain-containing protein [Verrucomicrobiota bacterium]
MELRRAIPTPPAAVCCALAASMLLSPAIQAAPDLPELSVDATGPAGVALGGDADCALLVRNLGKATARSVLVTDRIPAGLGGAREIPFVVGDLAPGESRTLNVRLKGVDRGRHCHIAVATASNASPVQDEACVTVFRPSLRLTVNPGAQEQVVGREARVLLSVLNDGDVVHEGATLTFEAPQQVEVASAPGATVVGRTVTWTLAPLKPGASSGMPLVLTSSRIGSWCGKVRAMAPGGLVEVLEICPVWKGLGALLVEFVDVSDPVPLGGEVGYVLRISNQGNADLTNLNASIDLDAETEPVSSPQGTIAGKKVKFPPIPKLEAGQGVTFSLTGRAVSEGKAYQKASVTVDGFKDPVEETEVTTLY